MARLIGMTTRTSFGPIRFGGMCTFGLGLDLGTGFGFDFACNGALTARVRFPAGPQGLLIRDLLTIGPASHGLFLRVPSGSEAG